MFNFSISNYPISINLRGKVNHDEQPELLFPIITMQQTHANHLQVVTEPRSQVLLDTDAALTTLGNVELQVKTADCLPIMLYHPLPLIGVVHAGRMGTEQKILENTLDFIKKRFQIDNNLEIFFGPAICEACYQIDRLTNLHFDLVDENIRQVRLLFTASQANIWESNQCTYHQPADYFSYRRDGKGGHMNISSIRLHE